MELQELHDDFINLGYTNFYIVGPGGPMGSDVMVLGLKSGLWAIYYTERGIDESPIFTTPDKDIAIAKYRDMMTHIEHWHIVAFTRYKEIMEQYRQQLEAHYIRTIQNDIPAYKTANDHVYRLFVVNKDIFKARELFSDLPYRDKGL